MMRKIMLVDLRDFEKYVFELLKFTLIARRYQLFQK